jgi:hypothetical protein
MSKGFIPRPSALSPVISRRNSGPRAAGEREKMSLFGFFVFDRGEDRHIDTEREGEREREREREREGEGEGEREREREREREKARVE